MTGSMNDRDRLLEQRLRAQTSGRGTTPDSRRVARGVLADFYEAQGQATRAALWADEDPGRCPRDNLVPNQRWQRKVVMWLLSNCTSKSEVARLFKSSRSWTGKSIREVEDKIRDAAYEELHRPTLAATRRLQAAGALPRAGGVFWLGNVPPKSWPATTRARP